MLGLDGFCVVKGDIGGHVCSVHTGGNANTGVIYTNVNGNTKGLRNWVWGIANLKENPIR